MKSMLKRILPAGLALALLLTGCSKNPVKQAEKNIEKVQKEYQAVVAKYDGGTVTAGEIMAGFNTQYNEMVSLAESYGYELTQSDIQGMMQSAMEARVRTEVIGLWFDAKYSLTDEEQTAIEEAAKSVYQSNYDLYYIIAEGETDAEKDAEVREVLTKLGMDYENTYNTVLLSIKNELMYTRIGEEITEVPAAQVKANYDTWCTDDSTAYYGHPDDFAYAMTQTGVNSYWMPSGFRTIKDIMITVDESLMTAYTDAVAAYDAAVTRVEELQEDVETLPAGGRDAAATELVYAKAALEPAKNAIDMAMIAMCESVQDKLVDIYTRLAAGESFDTLVAEYSEDPSMQTEPIKSRGFYISDKTTIWEPALQEAALALENVGDYSEQPIVTESGLHVVYYASKVKGGKVDYDTVYDTLYTDSLIFAREEHYNETVEGWMADVRASYDIATFVQAFAAAAK